MTLNREMKRKRERSAFSLVGVAEDKESAGLRHGNSLLLQLNVREWPRPWTHWHLWLVIILIPWWKDGQHGKSEGERRVESEDRRNSSEVQDTVGR